MKGRAKWTILAKVGELVTPARYPTNARSLDAVFRRQEFSLMHCCSRKLEPLLVLQDLSEAI